MAQDTLFAQVHRRMVDSGDWDSILATLTTRLNETGWTDDLKNVGRAHAGHAHPGLASFKTLLADLEDQGQAKVPLAVKQEITKMIKSYLERQMD